MDRVAANDPPIALPHALETAILKKRTVSLALSRASTQAIEMLAIMRVATKAVGCYVKSGIIALFFFLSCLALSQSPK
jgi:hypothetical protein